MIRHLVSGRDQPLSALGRAAAYLLLGAFALACSGDSAESDWRSSREVRGDTTIVTTLDGQLWPSPVVLEEDLRIGVLEGPPQLVFGEVSRLAEDLDGGIYVLDEFGPEIRRFSAEGEFVRTVGGPGRGPGEYQRLSLGMVVDSSGVLHMHDWGNRRIVRFADAGSPLEPWPIESSYLTTRHGRWVFSDGPSRVLLAARFDQRLALLVLEDGRALDTLFVPELPGVPEARGGPYRVEQYWTWHPDGYFVVGVSDEYSLDARHSSGVLRIRREVPPLPVHPPEAEGWRRYFTWMEQQPQMRAPEGEWIPSVMPPFREITVDEDGRIWVQRNIEPIRIVGEEAPDGPPAVSWRQPFMFDVYEPDGTFLGEVRFPDQFTPYLFGSGYVWGVTPGDFDEQYVVRLTVDYPRVPN